MSDGFQQRLCIQLVGIATVKEADEMAPGTRERGIVEHSREIDELLLAALAQCSRVVEGEVQDRWRHRAHKATNHRGRDDSRYLLGPEQRAVKEVPAEQLISAFASEDDSDALLCFARELEHRDHDRVADRFVEVPDDLREKVDVLRTTVDLGVMT